MARNKKEWPKIFITRGHRYHLNINAVTNDGEPILVMNENGTPVYIPKNDGTYEKKCQKIGIQFAFYKRCANLMDYCHVIVNEPKNKREEYIYSEILKAHEQGTLMTKDEFEESLNPEKKVTKALQNVNADLENENATLKKQYEELEKRLSQIDTDRKANK